MIKVIFISASLAALLAVTSCEKKAVEAEFIPENTIEESMVPVTLTASMSDTRVSLDGVSPKWTAGDKIALYTTDGAKCPEFTTQDGGGSSATFSGSKPDGSSLDLAVYPFSAAGSCSGGSCTLTLPSEQDGTLGSAVMAAKSTGEGEDLNFMNLCCVVKMDIPASLGVRRVEILRSDAVSGTFTLNSSTLSVSASSAQNSVAAVSSSGFSGEVLISVLPSSSKKIDLILTNASGKSVLISKDLSGAFTAGHIKNLGSVPANINFADVAKIGQPTSSQSYSAASQPDKPQVTNGDFENWTLDGDGLPNNWNSFQTAGGTYGGSAYDSKNRQVIKSSDKRPGSAGNYSCMIWARRIYIPLLADAVAQGNLTTGQIIAGNSKATGTGNYNTTKRNSYKTINKIQNPYFMSFTGRPDSLGVWVKFVPYGTDSSHPYAKVETILHTDVDYKSGYNSSDCTGGTAHVGEATDQKIGDTGGKWKRLSIPFKYDYTTTPSYILINIATNSYPGGGHAEKSSSGGNNADKMYIDDIVMVYNLYNVRTNTSGWATLCLDYNALVPSGATAYFVKKVACGYASLEAIPSGSVIPRNTGVLVKGSPNTTYSFNGRASDVSGKTPATVSGNLLVGALNEIATPSGTCRVLSSESTSAMAVFGAYSGTKIAANTAYLAQ